MKEEDISLASRIIAVVAAFHHILSKGSYTEASIVEAQKVITDEMSVPEDEVAFIHDANTEMQKSELFANVRKGNVRILLGSTFKMGAGMNVQKRLVAWTCRGGLRMLDIFRGT